MAIEKPQLPYAFDALEPHISKRTLEIHYGKHHIGYFNKLTAAIAGTDAEKSSLEDIVTGTNTALFNNAAQIWNHSFYWNCLRPTATKVETSAELQKAIERDFESFDKFREAFTAAALSVFGSGWAWLVKDGAGKLSIEKTSNAATPLTMENKKALLTCDVWEHAYYLDYQNARGDYIKAFWELVNWNFVSACYAE